MLPPFFSRCLFLALLAASMLFMLLAPNIVSDKVPTSPFTTTIESALRTGQLEVSVLGQILPLNNETSDPVLLLRCLHLRDQMRPLGAILQCQAIGTHSPHFFQSIDWHKRQSSAPLLINVLDNLLLPLLALCLFSLYCLLSRATENSIKLDAELAHLEKLLSQYLQCEQTEIGEKERLLQEASHDLRTRLHAVQLLAYALQQDAPLAMHAQVGKLNFAITQLQQFIQQFLSFARLQQGMEQVQWVHLPLQDVFQQLELQFEDIAIERNISLHLRPCNIWLTSDSMLLQRIVGNFLSNALKFARSRVLVVARVRGEEIWLEVRDDGPGIPASEQEAIFSAFYRSSQTRQSEQIPGVGLGLAIVRRLAQCMSYRVEVVSKLGSGTLLRLIIPLHNR